MNIQNSEKFYAQAQNFMPGGVTSPVRACRAVGDVYKRQETESSVCKSTCT